MARDAWNLHGRATADCWLRAVGMEQRLFGTCLQESSCGGSLSGNRFEGLFSFPTTVSFFSLLETITLCSGGRLRVARNMQSRECRLPGWAHLLTLGD